MRLHRNSQKRIYVPGGIYFITTNTYHKHPYFDNDILCELFLETLDFTSLLKGFNLHGLAINPDHLHLLNEPTGKYNYSEIMGALKRNFARDCNDLISGRNFRRDGMGCGGDYDLGNDDSNGGDDSNHRLLRGAINRKYMDIRGNSYFKAHLERLSELQTRYAAVRQRFESSPSFRWQSSFRDHLIRDGRDYLNHLNYIKNQPLKHGLPGRKWYWVVE